MVFAVRHGERADNSPYEEELARINPLTPWDPTLTKHGEMQAQETGKFLAEFLLKEKFEIVVIETSPFLRCL